MVGLSILNKTKLTLLNVFYIVRTMKHVVLGKSKINEYSDAQSV